MLKSDSTLSGSPTYDQVLTFIGCGRYQYFQLLVCGLCLMTVTIEALNLSFTMPFVQCELNVAPESLGLVATTGMYGLILSSHAWGFLVDTWGRVKVLRTALVMCLVFSVLSSLSTTVAMLVLTRLAVGIR